MERTLRSGAVGMRSRRYSSSALGRSPSSRDPLGRVAGARDIRARTEERRVTVDMRRGGCLEDARKSLTGLGQRSIIIVVRLTPIRIFDISHCINR